MRTMLRVLGVTTALGLGISACENGDDEQVRLLEEHLRGLEESVVRGMAMSAAAAAQSFPDTIDCGWEATYSDTVAATYKVRNRCEFSAYLRYYDASGTFIRQERIEGRDSPTASISAGESLNVVCTLVETVRNEKCIVQKL